MSARGPGQGGPTGRGGRGRARRAGGLLAGLLLCAPVAAGASEAAPAAGLVGKVRLGQSPAEVAAAARALGATVTLWSHDTPGALAAGLLERPDLLAMLHDSDVQPAGLEDGATRVSVATASLSGSAAAYWFVDGRLWALALALPQRAVAPRRDPFDPQRMQPLWDTLAATCGKLRVERRDKHGNPVGWAGTCAGGQARMGVDAADRDAAVRVVVWRP